MSCDSCAAVTIQGVLVHEKGCPKEPRECRFCGMMFTPERRHQRCCDQACEDAFMGGGSDDEN